MLVIGYFLYNLLIMRIAQKKEVSLSSFLRTLAISLLLGPVAGAVAVLASNRFTRYKGAERVQKELEYKMVKLIQKIEKQYKKLDNSQNEGRQNRLEKRLEKLKRELYDYKQRYTAAGGRFSEIPYLLKQRTQLEEKMDELARKIDKLQNKLDSGNLNERRTEKIEDKIDELKEQYSRHYTKYSRYEKMAQKPQTQPSNQYLEPPPNEVVSTEERRTRARANYQSFQQSAQNQSINNSNGIRR